MFFPYLWHEVLIALGTSECVSLCVANNCFKVLKFVNNCTFTWNGAANKICLSTFVSKPKQHTHTPNGKSL